MYGAVAVQEQETPPMASRVKSLKQAKADVFTEMDGLRTAAAGRRMTDEEKTKFAALETDFQGIEDDLEIEARHQDRQRQIAPVPDPNEPIEAAKAAKPAAADPKKHSGFGTLGAFLQGVAMANQKPGSLAAQQLNAAATGLGEGIPSDGGYLVDTTTSSEILKRVYEVGNLASRVRRIPIGPNANGIKVIAIDESSRVNGSRWGGVQGYWIDEAAEKTASKPKFRRIELILKKLAALAHVTDELLQDSTALEAIIKEALTDEMVFKLEDAIINGTGAGQPLGILNSGAVVSVAKETGQAASTLLFENIVKMWSRCWAKSRQTAVWLINQDIEPQLYSLSLTIGTGGVPVYLPANGISGQPFSTLFGRPVIPVEYSATLGTQGDIMLVDPQQYLLIEKGGVEFANSMHVRFIYDEMTFRFVYRVDGAPIWNAPLTPYKGSLTLSPYVVLDSRA